MTGKAKIKMDLDVRMKMYEKMREANLLQEIPIVVRCDGIAFHSFCRGMEKPFDPKLVEMMKKTTEYLLKKTNAKIAYTHSDEISLIFETTLNNSGGIERSARVQKLCSVITAKATAFFNFILPEYFPDKVKMMPGFDCRIFNIPTRWEAVNYLVWRENDATRCSISSLAQKHFSQKELHKKNSNEQQEMLFQKHGINWSHLEPGLKRGFYFQLKRNDDSDNRRVLVELDFPSIRAISNPVEVVFDYADWIEK
jgi:tRNA(His) 5'-end guanylyltransferase